MAKQKKTADTTILETVKIDAFNIAKKKGMKDTVQMFEAALIACAIEEAEGNYSAAARLLKIPVTTLGSRKDVLESLVKKFSRKLLKFVF